MIVLKATKKKSFTTFLENTILEKQQGEGSKNNFGVFDYITWITSIMHKTA